MPRDRQIICDVFRRSVSNPLQSRSGTGTGAPAAGIFRRTEPRKRGCVLMTQPTPAAPSKPATPAAPSKPATRIRETSPGTTDPLSTDDGKISVAQGVVQKIAG